MGMAYVYISIIILLSVVLFWPKGREKAVGICRAALGQSAKKEERKQRILKLLEERGELSNSDIRRVLGVSAATVTRYMDELEKEGKVAQQGDRKAAVYTKKI